MKRFLLLAALLVAAALSASCDQETNLSVVPDVDMFTFGPDGGEFDVVVFSNGHWKATCSDESISFTPDTADFTAPMHVKVGPNRNNFTKSVRITLVSKLNNISRTARIAVTQECGPFLTAASTEETIGRESGAARFSVNSNYPWHLVGITLDSAPYDGEAEFEPAIGGPNRTDVALLPIPENTTGRTRTFRITLALTEYPAVTLVLTVQQEA